MEQSLQLYLKSIEQEVDLTKAADEEEVEVVLDDTKEWKSKRKHQQRRRQTKEWIALQDDIQNIQDVIERFKKLTPDETECGCLKAIALLKPGQFGGYNRS